MAQMSTPPPSPTVDADKEILLSPGEGRPVPPASHLQRKEKVKSGTSSFSLCGKYLSMLHLSDVC